MSDKVIVQKCKPYQLKTVRANLNKALDCLQDIEEKIKPGMTVVIKPNLLSRKKPEQNVTTHPAIVQAVAERIIKRGARCIIADSPGGPNSKAYLKSVYKVTGMERVAKETGAELNYDIEKVEITFNKGSQFRKFFVLKTIGEADFIINIPKLKTHGLTLMTCAVKNLYGVIPGLIKGEYHLNLSNIDHFSSFLIDLALCITPGLTIVDAVVGMEGEGPSAGSSKETGMIFASQNSFLIDFVAASAAGIDPVKVPTIRESQSRGLCVNTLDEIDFAGTKDNFTVVPYKLPGTIKSIDFRHRLAKRIPERFLPTVYNFLKPQPRFNGAKCSGCRTCLKSCPPDAIKFNGDKISVNLDKCIRCYCCQELCPEQAVKISYPWLGRILFRGG